MKTESRWCSEYTSSSTEPVRLSHQNAVGTTTCLRRSVAYHCTKKREKKTRLPSQPTSFQRPQSMPSSLPSCQRRSMPPAAYRNSAGAAEHRLQHLVGAADFLGAAPVADEREDALGVLARHAGRLVGAHVGELAQRNVERDRDVVEAVDRDRLLAALHLADELAAEAGALAEPLLAQAVLLAQGAQPLAEEFAHMLDGPFSHWIKPRGKNGTSSMPPKGVRAGRLRPGRSVRAPRKPAPKGPVRHGRRRCRDRSRIHARDTRRRRPPPSLRSAGRPRAGRSRPSRGSGRRRR